MRSIYSIEYAEYFVVLCFVMVMMIVHCGFIYSTMSNRVSSQQQMRLQWQYRKGVDWSMSTISILTKDKKKLILWASYQICIIAGTHAPRMPGTFSPPPRVSYPDMRHCKRVTHVPRCAPGSLNSVFLWSRWQWKRSRHSRRMRKPQFCVSGNRPMDVLGILSTNYSPKRARFDILLMLL